MQGIPLVRSRARRLLVRAVGERADHGGCGPRGWGVVGEGFDGATTPSCIVSEGISTLAGTITNPAGTASAAVSGEACARTFVLTSDAFPTS